MNAQATTRRGGAQRGSGRRRPAAARAAPVLLAVALVILPAGCSMKGMFVVPQEARVDNGGSAEPGNPNGPTATSPAVGAPARDPARQAARRRQFDAAYADIYNTRYESAAATLGDLANSITPDDPLAPDILFWLGYARQEMGEDAAAGAAYDRLIRDWPGSPQAARAARLRAELGGRE